MRIFLVIFNRLTDIAVIIFFPWLLFKLIIWEIESPTNFPLLSDLEEGFEEEVKFVRENILIPFENKEAYVASGVLSLPRGILFRASEHDNCL